MTVHRLGVLVAFGLLACSGGTAPPDPLTGVRLLALDAGDEAADTAVREAVFLAVYCGVVEDRHLPTAYGMFTADGDLRVLAAVEGFVEQARAALGGMRPAARIEHIWGDAWGVEVAADASDCDASGLAPRER